MTLSLSRRSAASTVHNLQELMKKINSKMQLVNWSFHKLQRIAHKKLLRKVTKYFNHLLKICLTKFM